MYQKFEGSAALSTTLYEHPVHVSAPISKVTRWTREFIVAKIFFNMEENIAQRPFYAQ